MQSTQPGTVQIFVKEQRKTTTLSVVLHETTVAQVKRDFLAKNGLSSETKISLLFNGKPLRDDDQTLSACFIEKEKELEARVPRPTSSSTKEEEGEKESELNLSRVFPATYDEEVKSILSADLNSFMTEKGPFFVFSGIGSENASGEEARLAQQQCPQGLIPYCDRHNLALRILLIDLGFSRTTKPQIYSQGGSSQGIAWEERSPAANEKIRHYQYGTTPHFLTVYCTNVLKEEFDGMSETLTGVNLEEFKKEITRKGGQVLLGNFFDRTEPAVLCNSIELEEIL